MLGGKATFPTCMLRDMPFVGKSNCLLTGGWQETVGFHCYMGVAQKCQLQTGF